MASKKLFLREKRTEKARCICHTRHSTCSHVDLVVLGVSQHSSLSVLFSVAPPNKCRFGDGKRRVTLSTRTSNEVKLAESRLSKSSHEIGSTLHVEACPQVRARIDARWCLAEASHDGVSVLTKTEAVGAASFI